MGILDQLSSASQSIQPGLQQMMLMGGGLNQANLASRMGKANAIRDASIKSDREKIELARKEKLLEDIKGAKNRQEMIKAYLRYNPEAAVKYGQSLTTQENNDLQRKLLASKVGYYDRGNKGETGIAKGKTYKPTSLDLKRATFTMGDYLSKAGISRIDPETKEANPIWEYYSKLLGSKLVGYSPDQWTELGPLYANSILAFTKKPDKEVQPEKEEPGIVGNTMKAIGNISTGLANVTKGFRQRTTAQLPEMQMKAEKLLKQFKGSPQYSVAVKRLASELARVGNRQLSSQELQLLVKRSIDPSYIEQTNESPIRFQKQGPSLQRWNSPPN